MTEASGHDHVLHNRHSKQPLHSSMSEAPTAPSVPVTLKWSKHTFTNHLDIRPGSTSESFKDKVCSLTGVPVERQKLLCKPAWKGMLQDGITFDAAIGQMSELTVTLIGSADVLPDAPKERPKFIEDLTPEEKAEADAKAEAKALAESEGMIVALQTPPIARHADGDRPATEMYQYSRLVTGVPQRQVVHRAYNPPQPLQKRRGGLWGLIL